MFYFVKKKLLLKFISSFILMAFVWTSIVPPSFAQSVMLPAPGTMVNLSPIFAPALLKGMTLHKENPFKFDFIVDNGNSQLAGSELKKESERLVKYFLASMAVPKDDLWVNLSPAEKNRIVPEALGKTGLGQDLLAQDYILKQLTATLMYPEGELGKKFWDKIYAEAKAKFGTVNIPTDTFNKVWIMPESATIYENGATVYVVDAKMKVMLEEDYVATQQSLNGSLSSSQSLGGDPQDSKNGFPTKTFGNDKGVLTASIIKEIILPSIEKEVNEGKNFAPLRQIYYSLILAKWYKQKVHNSILSAKYIDQNKVAGIDENNPKAKEEIYTQYMEAYKKGVYNYMKEEYDAKSQQIVAKKYFSGGFMEGNINFKKADRAMTIAEAGKSNNSTVKVNLESGNDNAMLTEEEARELIKKKLDSQYHHLISSENISDVQKLYDEEYDFDAAYNQSGDLEWWQAMQGAGIGYNNYSSDFINKPIVITRGKKLSDSAMMSKEGVEDGAKRTGIEQSPAYVTIIGAANQGDKAMIASLRDRLYLRWILKVKNLEPSVKKIVLENLPFLIKSFTDNIAVEFRYVKTNRSVGWDSETNTSGGATGKIINIGKKSLAQAGLGIRHEHQSPDFHYGWSGSATEISYELKKELNLEELSSFVQSLTKENVELEIKELKRREFDSAMVGKTSDQAMVSVLTTNWIIQKTLNSTNPQRRIKGIEILAGRYLKKPKQQQMIKAAVLDKLGDSDQFIREQARKVLDRLKISRDEIVAGYIKALKFGEYLVRVGAIRNLMGLKAAETVPSLENIMRKDPQAEARKMAVEAILALTNDQKLKTTLDKLTKEIGYLKDKKYTDDHYIYDLLPQALDIQLEGYDFKLVYYPERSHSEEDGYWTKDTFYSHPASGEAVPSIHEGEWIRTGEHKEIDKPADYKIARGEKLSGAELQEVFDRYVKTLDTTADTGTIKDTIAKLVDLGHPQAEFYKEVYDNLASSELSHAEIGALFKGILKAIKRLDNNTDYSSEQILKSIKNLNLELIKRELLSQIPGSKIMLEKRSGYYMSADGVHERREDYAFSYGQGYSIEEKVNEFFPIALVLILKGCNFKIQYIPEAGSIEHYSGGGGGVNSDGSAGWYDAEYDEMVITQQEDVRILSGNLLSAEEKQKYGLNEAPPSNNPGMIADKKVGGIDMNNIELKGEKDGNFSFTFDPAVMEKFKDVPVDHLSPVIIDIVPVSNILPLLGLKEEGKEKKIAKMS